jgi:hypothetical protein
VPLNFSSEEPEEPGGRATTIVSAFTSDAWGGTDDDEEPDGRGHTGYWCINTPDAYRGARPVYRSLEHELRKGIGDAAYEQMAELRALSRFHQTATAAQLDTTSSVLARRATHRNHEYAQAA